MSCFTVTLSAKPFLLSLRRTMLQCVEYVALEQLLIRHSDLDWHVCWTVFTVPVMQQMSKLLCTHPSQSTSNVRKKIARPSK